MEQAAFDLGDAAEPEPTLTVSELTAGLREAVRGSFPGELWVRGEVQNLKRSQNGHTYFALVEKAGRGDQSRARIDVTLFRDDRRTVDRAIKEVPGAELGNDVEVRIRGRVEVYAPQGRLQLIMSGIDPVFTVGGIAAGRERVLRELAAEGLLERQRPPADAAGAAADRPGHERGQRGVPRLRAGAEEQRVSRSRWAWSTCGCRAQPRRAASCTGCDSSPAASSTRSCWCGVVGPARTSVRSTPTPSPG